MIFVKESLKDACTLSCLKIGTSEEIEQLIFLKEFQDLFIDGIPMYLPPTRGIFDHIIELLPRNSQHNKPPCRVS